MVGRDDPIEMMFEFLRIMQMICTSPGIPARELRDLEVKILALAVVV